MTANSPNLDPLTSARAAFAAELRKHRTQRNLSQEQVARVLACDQSLISAMENCKRTPQPDQARRLDQFFDLIEKKVFVKLCERIARETRGPRWLLQWTDEIDPVATVQRTWAPLLVPGLFQVEAYAREIYISSSAAHPPEAIEELLKSRMQRKALLHKNPPAVIWDLIDEGVLHRPIGGVAVHLEQLRYLLEISHHPAVTIQIVPLSAGCAHALMGTFVLAEIPGQAGALLLESAGDQYVITDPLAIARLQRSYDTIRAYAQPKKESQQIIRGAIEKWGKEV
ncbi:hypothetical protein C1I98_13195 [Spongiactinospora gelatinilytica]|uniref:HTH cro/C1-type domain-containing protein n=1 Tax=Spongiactinospora gelatinilytica TaxID=2666298 RepID=A0A2W2HDC3_9ACTN|nr:helix-turn-helix transcriptional regulator [Spongiactinospora gelatinilytica]PZG47588.1 hypothetical protein C1I98_13195 [Spongiactinospora gelatinilytica]